MSTFAYGIHAVDGLLRRSPDRVVNLSVQADRNDKRIQALLALAMNQGVGVTRSSKRDLDTMVSERHQGVVATIEPLDVQVHERKRVVGFFKSETSAACAGA